MTTKSNPILTLVIAIALSLLYGIAVMALWNFVAPDLFGLPRIAYWHGLCLFVLTNLLTSGHGSKGVSG